MARADQDKMVATWGLGTFATSLSQGPAQSPWKAI